MERCSDYRCFWSLNFAMRRAAFLDAGGFDERYGGEDTDFGKSLDRQGVTIAWLPGVSPAQTSVLHNGIDPEARPFQATGDGSAVWYGRINANKGHASGHRGCPVCRHPTDGVRRHRGAGLLGKRGEAGLGGAVRYGGHLDARALASEVARASVSLFTAWRYPKVSAN